MRLIDADALKEKVSPLFIDAACRDCPVVRGFVGLGNLINDAPTVDAELVRHGHWIEHYAFGCFHYDCSICDDGFAIKNKQKELPNYCANCGAKMQEVIG